MKELGLPLTLNIVLHRENLDRVEEIIALAERLGADRLELANTQYLGWALRQPRRAPAHPRAARARARGGRAPRGSGCAAAWRCCSSCPTTTRSFPKACMDGWGRRFVVVAPDGLVLPCHAAHTLPGLSRSTACATRPLGEIWRDSAGFNALPRRGLDARALPELRPARPIDFGGCRCQAFQLTGDAAATDPVCSLSPRSRADRDGAREARSARGGHVALEYRTRAGPPHRRDTAATDGREPLDPAGADRRRGRGGARRGIRRCRCRASPPSGRLFGGVWIELALGFVLAGLHRRADPAADALALAGRRALGQGILVGWAAGLVMPGGPYLVFPVVANLFKNGAARRPADRARSRPRRW